jgi:arylsulfatase A-like enzyme
MSAGPIRNVLFIMVGQLRGDCLSRLDHPRIQAPNLDRLAASKGA